MKRVSWLFLALCLLAPMRAFAARSVTEDSMRRMIEESAPGDASRVSEADGRVTGPVYGPNGETGEPGERLWVDAPLPADFAADQRAVITAEPIDIDRETLLRALRETGARPSDMVIRPGVAYNDGVGLAVPATGAPLSHEAAEAIARRLVADCGLGDAYAIDVLRPEERARGLAAQEAPEAQEAACERYLREWHRQDRAYTDVQLGFTLRGLPVAPEWRDSEGVWNSSIVHLSIGDAGEVRDYSLWYAPREVSAEAWTGPLKTWREALAEFSCGYSAHNAAPRMDERGRAQPPLRHTVTAIMPGYASRDGRTFAPAWIFLTDAFALGGEQPEPVHGVTVSAIDARVGF